MTSNFFVGLFVFSLPLFLTSWSINFFLLLPRIKCHINIFNEWKCHNGDFAWAISLTSSHHPYIHPSESTLNEFNYHHHDIFFSLLFFCNVSFLPLKSDLLFNVLHSSVKFSNFYVFLCERPTLFFFPMKNFFCFSN